MRTIETKTADDGTELVLKQRDEQEYIVTEQGSDQPTGRIEPTVAKGRVNLAETARFYGIAERSKQT